jgi:hypothetical protein
MRPRQAILHRRRDLRVETGYRRSGARAGRRGGAGTGGRAAPVEPGRWLSKATRDADAGLAAGASIQERPLHGNAATGARRLRELARRLEEQLHLLADQVARRRADDSEVLDDELRSGRQPLELVARPQPPERVLLAAK